MSSSSLNAEALLKQVEQDLKALLASKEREDPLMIGIHTGGVWLAERLHKALNLNSPMGVLDISFHRDDFNHSGLSMGGQGQSSQLPVTEGRHVLLVDDVIMSGRTIRAALNELFDYGRPASVTLITLLDLQRRELPIQADVTGGTLALGSDQQVKLTGPHPLELEIRQK
ncbi:bifunctional pyr operon transcriptional regulator/uracil phosphoribosyltransferase PyrR [Pontibacter sp. JAM-7]|uniref:bifunctional pyr operon transcriptional regulator/uracil phosphoribosyltransferase PyrR n=1 Tax=Pontibacter sp. JAM-7 TaxID=3366581 RepID=UPI003AF8E645